MELNKSNVKKILGIITFAVLLLVGAMHLDIVFGVLQKGVALLKPFIIGGAMAFIMNVLLRIVEDRLFAPLNRKNFSWWNRYRRPVCVVLTLGILIGIIFVLLFMIIPEIVNDRGTAAGSAGSLFWLGAELAGLFGNSDRCFSGYRYRLEQGREPCDRFDQKRRIGCV